MAPERILRAGVAAVVLLWSALPGAAAGPATVEVPMRDPWVPPEIAKKARAEPASSGAALREQVERKLRARFDAAADARGLLTRDRARAAGLGFIERHFDAIDRRGAGQVSYEDYRAFLRSRGARLD